MFTMNNLIAYGSERGTVKDLWEALSRTFSSEAKPYIQLVSGSVASDLEVSCKNVKTGEVEKPHPVMGDGKWARYQQVSILVQSYLELMDNLNDTPFFITFPMTDGTAVLAYCEPPFADDNDVVVFHHVNFDRSKNTVLRGVTMNTLKVSEHTLYPGPRYVADGSSSGQWFRERVLVPVLAEYPSLIIDMNDTVGYGSSWLEEVFGGLVRALSEHPASVVKHSHLTRKIILGLVTRLVTEDPSIKHEIMGYIDEELNKLVKEPTFNFDLQPTLAWLDMEMTGLSSVNDKVMEIAIMLTTDDLTLVAAKEWTVSITDDDVANMSDFVLEMHSTNGLIVKCLTSGKPLAEVEQDILLFLKAHGEPKSLHPAGNSIHKDRAFIEIHLPLVDAYLHHRQLDVTSIRMFYERVKPDDHLSYTKPKEKAHSATDDVLGSIDEYRFYLNKFPQATFDR